MKPKKQANILIEKYMDTGIAREHAKECALICINMLIDDNDFKHLEDNLEYWMKTKRQVKK